MGSPMMQYEPPDPFADAATGRRTWLVAGVLALLLMGLCGLIGLGMFWHRLWPPEPDAVAAAPPQDESRHEIAPERVSPPERSANQALAEPATTETEVTNEELGQDAPSPQQIETQPEESIAPAERHSPPVSEAVDVALDEPAGIVESVGERSFTIAIDHLQTAPDESSGDDAKLIMRRQWTKNSPPSCPLNEIAAPRDDALVPVMPPHRPTWIVAGNWVNKFRRRCARDPALLESHMDWSQVLERMLEGFAVSNEVRQHLLNQLQAAGFAAAICAELGEVGAYDFLRVRDVDGERRLMFRFATPNGGLNYQEFVAFVQHDGQLRFVDVYNWVFGEWVSRLQRRMAYPWLLEHAGRVVALPGDPNSVAEALTVVELIRQARTSEPVDLAKYYDPLSPEVKQSYPLRIIHISLASRGNIEEWKRGFADLETNFPDEPSSLIARIRAFPPDRDRNEMFALLTKLDAHVGGDPYLQVLMGHTASALGQYDAAWGYYQVAKARAPRLAEASIGQFQVAVKQERFSVAVDLLEELQMKWGLSLNDLDSRPEFAKFVQSAEYLGLHDPERPLELARRSVSKNDLYKKFGEELQDRLNARESGFLNQTWNSKTFFCRALRRRLIKEESHQNFLKWIPAAATLEADLRKLLGSEGRAKMLDVVERDGHPAVLLRLVTAEHGVSYVECLLTDDAQGRVQWIDLRYSNRGEYQSRYVRQQMLCAPRTFGNHGLRPAEVEMDFVNAAKDLNLYSQYLVQNQYEKAWQVALQLPDSVRYDPGLAWQLVQTACNTEETRGEAMLDELRERYPDHVGIALSQLNFLAWRSRYDELVPLIEMVERAVGEDPYLNVYRGGVWAQQGEDARAQEAFDAALHADPSAPFAYVEWARWRARESNFDALEQIVKQARQAGVTIDFRAHPDFAEYLAKIDPVVPDAALAGDSKSARPVQPGRDAPGRFTIWAWRKGVWKSLSKTSCVGSTRATRRKWISTRIMCRCSSVRRWDWVTFRARWKRRFGRPSMAARWEHCFANGSELMATFDSCGCFKARRGRSRCFG